MHLIFCCSKQELAKSYFQDYVGKDKLFCAQTNIENAFFVIIEASEWHGKLYCALERMTPEEASMRFPLFRAKNLLNQWLDFPGCLKGKVSVIAYVPNNAAHSHTRDFVAPTLRHFSNHPQFQCLEVILFTFIFFEDCF